MKTSSRFIFKDGQQKSGCKASFAFRFALRRELNQFTLCSHDKMKKSLWQSCLLSDVRDYLDCKISYIRSKDELFKSLFWQY